MTNSEKNLIADLQKQGYGYKKISSLTGLSLNSVKSYCQRHPVSAHENVCPACGNALISTPHKKTKKFCSDKCRISWWNSHKDVFGKTYTSHTCKHCGNAFTSYGNAPRVYCSRACYDAARGKLGATV